MNGYAELEKQLVTDINSQHFRNQNFYKVSKNMATHDIEGAVSGSSRHATIREQLNRTTNPVNPEYNYPGAKELKDNLKLNPELLKPS